MTRGQEIAESWWDDTCYLQVPDSLTQLAARIDAAISETADLARFKVYVQQSQIIDVFGGDGPFPILVERRFTVLAFELFWVHIAAACVIAAEREACARIADNAHELEDFGSPPIEQCIAAAIRARGSKP